MTTEATLRQAMALHQAGRLAEAEPLYRQALALMPRDVGLNTNLGTVLLGLSRPQEALGFFDTALALAPGQTVALTNRGLALRALNRHEPSLADLDKVVRLLPGDAGALVNRASALWSLGQIEAALADYDAALGRDPDLAGALRSRANLLWTRKQALAPALADLKRLAQVVPHDAEVAADLLHLKMHAGDWSGFDAAKSALDAAVRTGRAVIEPFVYQGLSDSPADLQACARAYVAHRYPPAPPLFRGMQRKPGRIRIGYVSGEFRAQATAYLAAGLYEAHDRTRFEVIAFDNTRPEHSPMRSRLEAAFDRMIDITALSDLEAAQRVRAEEVDILVNLNGWFGALRMGVFAHRPAPIQVNYLGFPGTLGAPYMDYILADAVVIPPGEEVFFDEAVMRLPASYQINDSARAMAPAPPPRHELGLPEDVFVFAHFNYSYKIVPSMFALWLRLLAAVPKSVLWLLETSELFASNVRAAAVKAGIDPARLVFAPPLEHAQHLARLGAADLFLDSLPYGAHTTGSDALWVGLPLLTCRGRSFTGRVGASLLTAMEMPELITEDLAAYEARALELARDPAQLAALREKLKTKRATAPLFDTARTTRAIEAAYQMMFERWQG
ncbi:MAG: tetratricopeptide repeat protein [Alphaproteobacteria bacterium]|nr:tetratricopeptide repeat protein [Alphaproteobacteria bacterium]